MSMADYRIGTVVILRDMTDQVLLERQRDILLQHLARSVQQPLAGMGQLGLLSGSDMVNAFAREISRQAVALHKMIVDMRELALVDGGSVERRQRPLHLETLIWAVANEWRQVAQANKLTMHLLIERKDLFVLADERRIRWAIGNIIDNAIKYTPCGGALTLEIKEESDGMANLRVRDNGVGIARQERPYVFTRFYRGRPVGPDGHEIRVPGMGQGLYIAKRIFESHGGSIQIKTSQRVGTAVYMSLPLTAPVGLEMPYLSANMEGETMQLPEDFLVELEQDYIDGGQHRSDDDN
jgi:signal transduction histidine kinase